MKELLGLAIVVLIVWLGWQFLHPVAWYGTWETRTGGVGSQEVGSRKACQSWLESQSINPPSGHFNFECGSNCKLDPVASMYYCNETFN